MGRRRERGAIAVLVALSLVALIGAVGLALDLGKLYVVKSELQNSADSCALAAVRDLTGATIDLSVPEAAGITAGHANYKFFQSSPVQLTVNSSVTFSDSLSNPFLPKTSVTNPSTMKYVKCTTSLANVPNWFIQVLDMLPGVSIANASVSSFAVAQLGPSQTTCAIPVFVCTKGTSPTYSVSHTIGEWVASKSGASPAFGPGNFGWAALDGSDSANSIKNELTSNYCSMPAVGSSIGTTGNKVADASAYNTRFGIYSGSYTQSGATPDFTGYAYTKAYTWSSGSNAYSGDNGTGSTSNFISERAKFAAYQGDSAVFGNGNGGTGNGSSSSTNYTLGADRRLALAPEVDCSVLGTSGTHQMPILWWDCVLMLDPMQSTGQAGPVHLEYEGKSTDASVPCATHGTPGDSHSVGPRVPVLIQ
ncbi:pilus assembly protein TadG [Trinickia symbiotica]|uniref:Pilus assembly protein TadG n=2 Tax=Trinickia symbiotica TaxID=863227 RepID=A0A2T3XUZ4_9BURK|nr:pilus assembly protein TadG [Trinickia symbiotica]